MPHLVAARRTKYLPLVIASSFIVSHHFIVNAAKPSFSTASNIPCEIQPFRKAVP
jgi:hypothetical protein